MSNRTLVREEAENMVYLFEMYAEIELGPELKAKMVNTYEDSLTGFVKSGVELGRREAYHSIIDQAKSTLEKLKFYSRETFFKQEEETDK